MHNDKNLNSLDGSSVLDEVLYDQIVANRKSYKTAIRNAVIRNDKSQEMADKALDRARRSKGKLDALVEGGLDGFLNKVEAIDEEEDDDVATSINPPKKKFGSSSWRNRE